MRPLLAAAMIVAFSGCAAPPTIGEALPAPGNRLLALQAEDRGKDATVTVVRESAIQAGHCFFGVYLDGQLVARLDNNEKASFHVKPGRRLVGVGSDPQGAGSCSGNSAYRREVATWIEIGEQQTFRIAFLPMLDIRPSSY
ncbi:3-isopropylmalate dehydratase [Pseudomonas donghuensis]|uniref:3-isopropylmalate dehydratase n=1 Tax=Pseudomonas donghuensis TaxID=1163398 RepID=UPI00215F27A4|nr:3-isopropylmalate dehydratase [Pseudomonas donghuensis]UVL30137.1 3-isopropylmalate dehydratase [Pseudomonas donghuensis]